MRVRWLFPEDVFALPAPVHADRRRFSLLSVCLGVAGAVIVLVPAQLMCAKYFVFVNCQFNLPLPWGLHGPTIMHVRFVVSSESVPMCHMAWSVVLDSLSESLSAVLAAQISSW